VQAGSDIATSVTKTTVSGSAATTRPT
jgi:hypothetical protein